MEGNHQPRQLLGGKHEREFQTVERTNRQIDRQIERDLDRDSI